VALDRRHIAADPIKTLGEHSVTVKLHSDVQFPLRLEIVSS
jgi:ribosomal protein L9